MSRLKFRSQEYLHDDKCDNRSIGATGAFHKVNYVLKTSPDLESRLEWSGAY
jgi:hypothetical protein